MAVKSGRRKPRKARPNQRVSGYDSKFEKDLHEDLLYNWEVHGEKIAYYSKHTYHPDFVRKIGDTTYLIEAKGRFWDSSEYSKYLWVRECMPENYKLIFIFMKPSHPMPNAKKRKDGTKRTHGDWAEANGFEHYTMENFPEELK